MPIVRRARRGGDGFGASTTRLPARGSRRAFRGLTLIEATLAVTLLAAGAITAMSVIVSSLRLDATNRETKAAFDAARAQMERLRAESFDRIPVLFDADPQNDPDGAGTAPGTVFAAESLRATAVGAAGAGEIVLPVDAGGRIRENLTIPEIGMPRDLNGDIAVDSADHSSDAIALPVLVRVRWTGTSGPREIFVASVLHR